MNMRMRGIVVVAVVAAASAMLFSWPDARADGERYRRDEDDERHERHERREPHEGAERSEREGRDGRGSAMALDDAWLSECGACHVAYPPELLPAASWDRVMDGLSDHFGDNAELPTETAARIRRFLRAHAADARAMSWGYDDAHEQPRRAARTGFDTPMRITETRWFMHAHDEIRAQVWQRASVLTPANCAACHRGAEQGDFDEHRVRIPK